MAAVFSVLVVSAPPPGLGGEAGGYQVKVDGRENLLRSVELFLNRPDVGQVRVAMDEAGAEDARRRFGNHLSFSGVKVVWSTGRRADQLAAGVDGLAADATHVVVHDAARPCVPYPDVDALLAAAAAGADAAADGDAPTALGVAEAATALGVAEAA
ncbi:MAG: 2-C-methyl-D-erythritol 4-phosphate cytidylyltransferase, partial [Phycisphaerales bacterium]|nr:2-C-methyl-D-erythritol 4-phosphate cytidylyltransferase [Phycisphaerales bacterium]